VLFRSLYAIRPTSPYAKIGLQNGDTISAINNFEITTPDKALDAYNAIRTAKDITIELSRRGKPMILEITITK
jgi:general secretion pathway protein C